MEKYNHKAIEESARAKWAGLDLYSANLADDTKDPYYLLVEFPYPSGDLHIGHWYAFAVTDIYARLLRARGKNVLFPIGFDAFGLPAENAAIKNNVDPREWTYKNIERMREQLATMGASFDWSKEVLTCDPSYYQWTQWLFAKFFEHNLAERRLAAVKWCPKDQTVLANEQVIDGACERCGTPVEEKQLTQWFLKITNYAERLLTGLDALPWREEIKEAQRAWIGKSEGAYIEFSISGREEKIKVFTTRPDTIYGATFVVLAPEHPLVSALLPGVSNKKEVKTYVEKTKRKTERERSENKEKTGIKLEGVTAINPANKEEIPVYVADFVLGSYGTGAIMGVPAHDERDYAFARKFEIPIILVIEPPQLQISFLAEISDEDTSEVANGLRHFGAGKSFILAPDRTLSFINVYTGDGEHVNSDFLNGLNNADAIEKTIQWLEKEKYGTGQAIYRLRDWLVSRQRYWGCPIPIVYDPEGKPHAIPAEHLPWLLPTDVDFKPTGKAPLASSKELQERVINIFGEGWTPEYDTLDTFVDSSWYFLRYLDPKDSHDFSDVALMKKWMPVNRYSGGSEHTTMHLFYARFWTMALYDLALVPVEEPFTERFNRGLIVGPDGHKMSKSKGNVVNPDEFVQKYGADAVRMYLAFIGPYNESGSYPWSLEGVAAVRKFLERVVRMIEKEHPDGASDDRTRRLIGETARKISADGDRFKFNTAVAALMILLNHLDAYFSISPNTARAFIIMLAPFAPHLAEHLWEKLGGEGSVHQQPWPTEYVETQSESDVVVQVNGKRRGSLTLAADVVEADVTAAARLLPTVITALAGKEPKRVVYVPGKIINLVV